MNGWACPLLRASHLARLHWVNVLSPGITGLGQHRQPGCHLLLPRRRIDFNIKFGCGHSNCSNNDREEQHQHSAYQLLLPYCFSLWCVCARRGRRPASLCPSFCSTPLNLVFVFSSCMYIHTHVSIYIYVYYNICIHVIMHTHNMYCI